MIFRGAFLIFLWLGVQVDAKCNPTWSRVRNADDARIFGVSAGFHDEGIQTYVGRTSTGAHRIPARIQINPLEFHYSYNTRNKVVHQGDFLKNNSDFDYVWVKANSKNCIDSAVVVDNLFFIGRTSVNGFWHLGNVMIGKVGIRYPSKNGNEVISNDYEVLTCVEKSCSKEEADKCQKRVENLENTVEQLNQKSDRLEEEVKEAKSAVESERENSKLLRDILKVKEKKLNECLEDCRTPEITTTTRRSPTTSAPGCQDNLDECEQDKNNILKDFAKQHKELKGLQDKIKDLQTDNDCLKADNQILKNSCAGIESCVKALESLDRKLTEAEMKKILDAVQAKLPDEFLVGGGIIQ